MRVGLISREYPPFTGGGIGSYARRFAQEMAARDHDVFVLTVSDDGREHRETVRGVEVIRIPFVRGNDWSAPDPAVDDPQVRAAFSSLCPTAALSLLIHRRLPALLDEFRPDVLEFPDTGALGWFTLNARITEGWRTPPIVVCAHSPTAWVNEHNRDPGVDRAGRALIELEADCFDWADGLVCPSRALASRVQADHQREVEAIPLPIGELADVRRTDPSPGTKHLLFAGRLEPRKGVDLLLAALTEALGRGVDLHLDLAGADAVDQRTRRPFGADAIDRLVPRAFRSCLTHHDQLDADQLTALRARASVAVVPSPNDNYPYTCVEAMASGLGVLATRAGGMAEMIRDGLDGQLLAPTVDAWTEALISIARADPTHVRMMGESARARINAICGNDSVISRRIAHFERVTTTPLPDRDGPVVVINAGATPDHVREHLARAARRVGGFSIGWPVGRAAPSPSVRWMALVDDGTGPICIDQAVFDRLRDALPPVGADDVCEDAPDLVRALLAAGVAGAVVPSAPVDAPEGRRSGRDRVPHDSIPAAVLARERARRRDTPRRAARIVQRLKRTLRRR